MRKLNSGEVIAVGEQEIEESTVYTLNQEVKITRLVNGAVFITHDTIEVGGFKFALTPIVAGSAGVKSKCKHQIEMKLTVFCFSCRQ